jgi:hypothetical protein
MTVIYNYFKDPIKNLSIEKLKDLHGHYVVSKANACQLRIFTISSLALSILSILHCNIAIGTILGLIAVSLAAYDFIKSYKVSLIENLLQEKGVFATHQIHNWGWSGFSYKFTT